MPIHSGMLAPPDPGTQQLQCQLLCCCAENSALEGKKKKTVSFKQLEETAISTKLSKDVGEKSRKGKKESWSQTLGKVPLGRGQQDSGRYSGAWHPSLGGSRYCKAPCTLCVAYKQKAIKLQNLTMGLENVNFISPSNTHLFFFFFFFLLT